MPRKNKKSKPSRKITARIVGVLLVLFLVIVIGRKMTELIKHASLFSIKKITHHPSLRFINSVQLDALKGQNIYEVDTVSIQKDLQKRYPAVSQLRVLRRLPDEIHIEARMRLPVAKFLIADRFYVVDKKCTVFPQRQSTAFVLPLVTGFKSEDRIYQDGDTIRSAKCEVALAIISGLHRNKNLSKKRIIKIDVGNLSEIKLNLHGDIAVLIDANDIKRQLSMLEMILFKQERRPDEFKYIDLRFKEPIIRKNS